MPQASARLNIAGMLDFVPKSRQPLAAVFEAVTNSFEAISQRRKVDRNAPQGLVKVHFFRTGLGDAARKLETVEVIDNGIGFDASNYERFETFLDRSKGFNNRGSGRIQYLHAADKITVGSLFTANGIVWQREFVCTPKNFITRDRVKSVAPTMLETTVALSELKLSRDAAEYFETASLDELESAFRSHFLLWFHLERAENEEAAPSLEVALYKNGDEEGRRQIKAEDLPRPETGSVEVPYFKRRDLKTGGFEWERQPGHAEKLEWAHFKLPTGELAENGVLLCSKGVPVQRVPFDALKKTEAIGGSRFLTAFYGDVLNRAENVSHAVDAFTLPKRSEMEKTLREGGGLFLDPDQEIIFMEEIEDAVDEALPVIYKDLLTRRVEKGRDIDAIAVAHGIDPEIAKATKINLSDNEAQITEKLFKRQAEALAERSLKIKHLFEQLEGLDPTDANYQAELITRTEELLGLIPEQNKQELSRYVIRRQMVAKILGMIIDRKPSPRRAKGAPREREDREGLIHELLIGRRTETSEGPNDLWVLNEEFVHFEGVSEIALDQIVDKDGNKLLGPISDEDLERYGLKNKTLRRPDIFLFLEEGQCILVELKAPDVDLAEHLTQLERYCNLIGNFAARPITRFHCFLIGEVVSAIDVAGRYREDMNGDWINRADYKVMRFQKGRQEEEIGEAHIEIIKLSAIHHRALRRNKSFADRLGISDAVLK